MPLTLTRRQALVSSAALATGLRPGLATAQGVTQLVAAPRSIVVDGKTATVMGVGQLDGTPGMTLSPGQRFQVKLENRLAEDTIIHWHGQLPPDTQDGVALTGVEPLIGTGTSQNYDFVPRPGTYWMHSHQGLQEMQLLAAPLVVHTKEDLKADVQEVVVMLHDFTFKTPEQVMAQVTGGGMSGMEPPMAKSANGMGGMAMSHSAGPDLNDYDFDAYLANDRTLADPLVVRTERGGRVRLRIINGAAATAFWLDLGALQATVMAADGTSVRPVHGNRFPLAEAQRLDLLLTVPAGKAVPILAQREGDRVRTGIILAASGAAVTKVSPAASTISPPLSTALELSLAATEPLTPRGVDRRVAVVLTGDMHPYQWRINGHGWEDREPLKVSKGQRVMFDIVNKTNMAHPMHLHGHVFQVVAINSKKFSGAVRDTVNVPAHGTVSLAFDAINPGKWLFHCHNLLHMETGMITEVIYET